MSHPNRWRCACGTDLGTVERVGSETAVQTRDSVRRLLFNDRRVVAFCPSCGMPVEFKTRETAGTSVS